MKAELITTRLLSEDDKNDMVQGQLDAPSLLTAVKVWKDNGMPNYRDGSGDRYRRLNEKPMSRHRGRVDRIATG